MTILVFGHSGQVATELQRQAPVKALDRHDADLSVAGQCRAAILTLRPSAVINAAAYTAVDGAEGEPNLAHSINANAPTEMAEACAELGIPFVHLSTDYVFDGRGDTAWEPSDPTAPLSVYGKTKLAGEGAVRASGADYAILRTSWVFSAHGNNFVKTMLRLAETGDALRIVDDQYGGPTPACAIAAACLSIAAQLQSDPDKRGTYHFSGTPDVTWKEFAEAIFAASGQNAAVTGIPTSHYPTPATRPTNSRLDCGATTEAFGFARPDWKIALKTVLADLKMATETDPKDTL